MIDIRLLLDDFDDTARRLSRKGVNPGLLESARQLAVDRRERIQAVDQARAEMNAGTSEVGGLMRDGRRDEADSLRGGLAELGARLDTLEARRRDVQAKLDDVVSRVPNLPADDVPDGTSEADNVIL